MTGKSTAELIEELGTLFDASVERLRGAIGAYVRDGVKPDPAMRRDGSFAYPELRVIYSGSSTGTPSFRSFGRLTEAGYYGSSITRPRQFAAYLAEQINLLREDYEVEIDVGPGRQEIPFPYVLDAEMDLDQVSATELSRWFPATDLSYIGDEVADGTYVPAEGEPRPLALFDALRTDFSLARLRHYTGTPVEDVQRYILFTNYHRYVDEFASWALSQLGEGSRYTHLSGAGGIRVTRDTHDPESVIAGDAWRRHQMPAWHLCAPDKSGITLVNIGVGPANAKTITDHLAVVRPEAWLMIGHCGGLRPSQRIGDYVLAMPICATTTCSTTCCPPPSRSRRLPRCSRHSRARRRRCRARAARRSSGGCGRGRS